MLETENSSFYTTPLALTHCPRRYRCCQIIINCSYLVKWEVQSFLYEPMDLMTTNLQLNVLTFFWPHLQVLALSKTQIIVAWNLPSPLFEPRMRNSQWTIIMNGIVSMSMHCITSFRYQSQMLGRAPLPPCCNEASV